MEWQRIAACFTTIATYHYRRSQTLRNRLKGIGFVPISAYFYLLTKNICRAAELSTALTLTAGLVFSVYHRARYVNRIDYRQAPPPSFPQPEQAWLARESLDLAGNNQFRRILDESWHI